MSPHIATFSWLTGLTVPSTGTRVELHGQIRPLFTTLSMIAEADLARARTREGIAVARAKGRLPGEQPKLSPKQEAHLVELYHDGGHALGELEELFPVTRSSIYRAIARAAEQTSPPRPNQNPKSARSRRTNPR